MDRSLAIERPPRRYLLGAEFLLLFAGVPVAMLLFWGEYDARRVFGILILVGLILLAITRGFRWRELLRFPVREALWILPLYTVLTAGIVYSVTMLTVPERLFSFPLHNTGMWLTVMAAYPFFSAIPQELIYKPLFFRRYGALIGNGWFAVVLNAAAFSAAHLFYQNPVALGVTFAGGLMMGWAWVRTHSFLLVCIMHALAGQMIFTFGLGTFFYHGAIPG